MVVWCYAWRPDCSQLSNGIVMSQVIRTQLSDTLPVHSGIAHFQFTMPSCAKAAVGHITTGNWDSVTARCLLFLDAVAFFCGLYVLYSLAKAEAYIYICQQFGLFLWFKNTPQVLGMLQTFWVKQVQNIALLQAEILDVQSLAAVHILLDWWFWLFCLINFD